MCVCVCVCVCVCYIVYLVYMLCVFDGSSPSHHATKNRQQLTLVMLIDLNVGFAATDNTQAQVTLYEVGYIENPHFEYGFIAIKMLETTFTRKLALMANNRSNSRSCSVTVK